MTDTIEQVPTDQVLLIWPEASLYLKHAVSGIEQEEFLNYTKGRLCTGLEQLWILYGGEFEEVIGYATTSLYTKNGLTKTAVIQLGTADDLEMFLSYLNAFECWARGKEVDYIQVIGRKGWERVLRPEGFTFDFVSLIKPVIKELH